MLNLECTGRDGGGADYTRRLSGKMLEHGQSILTTTSTNYYTHPLVISEEIVQAKVRRDIEASLHVLFIEHFNRNKRRHSQAEGTSINKCTKINRCN